MENWMGGGGMGSSGQLPSAPPAGGGGGGGGGQSTWSKITQGEREKGYGAIKQSLLAAKGYITAPGTTMGVGQFYDQGQLDQAMANIYGVMQGTQPSAAELQARGNIGQLSRGMASAALTGGGGMQGSLGMRGAALQGGLMGVENINQMAALRAQEQATARDQYLAALQQQLQLEGLGAQNYATALNRQRQQGEGMAGQVLGGLTSAAGTIAGAALLKSDERVKTDKKKNVKKAFDDFLKKVSASSYKYVGEDNTSFGVMAQDLEKSDVGKTLVKEVGGVKMIDTVKGFGTTLAALKRLAQRVEALEVG